MSSSSIISSPTSLSTSSSTPSGSNSNTSSSGNNEDGSSASLYLYTFLATLVLLLSISAAIIARSFVLRRRHRRLVEEAILNGTYVPPNVLADMQGRIDLSKTPTMWEATVHSKWSGRAGTWGDILPVTASLSTPSTPKFVQVASNSDGLEYPEHRTGITSHSHGTTSAPVRIAMGMRRLVSSGANPVHTVDSGSFSSPLTPSVQLHQIPSQGDTAEPKHVEVAVLIAMPGAFSAAELWAKDGREHEDLPHVEIGMSEVMICSLMPDYGS